MNPKIKLRKFKLSDLNRILEIEQSSFSIDAYPKERFERLAKLHPQDFIVAENQGKILGYIIAYNSSGNGNLDSIAIDPKYRKLGIGSQLVNYTIERFKKMGLKKVFLEVRTTNKKAISFFKKLGFEIKKMIKDYYRDKGNAYLMEKEI